VAVPAQAVPGGEPACWLNMSPHLPIIWWHLFMATRWIAGAKRRSAASAAAKNRSPDDHFFHVYPSFRVAC
jgi:hypothetical protein